MKTAGHITLGGILIAILVNLAIWVPVFLVSAYLLRWLTKPGGGFAKGKVFADNYKAKREAAKASKASV